MRQICADTAAEHDALDVIVASLSEREWRTPTPATGWDVADSISHLWFFDQRALLAITDPEAFAADRNELFRTGVDASVAPGRSITGADLLIAWRSDRARLLVAAAAMDPSTRVPWYGPAMGARSFLTARLMETWAHGQDVVDALGAVRPESERLRHVAHLGVRARPFSYANRSMAVPDVAVSVRLTSPGGALWKWDGPRALDDHAEVSGTPEHLVAGSALDFCLVVTQRRHLSDTDLRVSGDAAIEWMSIAQAFAGAPSDGRAPLG